jgi:ABC-type transport system involved in multi-copper enzyme maturation permease subunit
MSSSILSLMAADFQVLWSEKTVLIAFLVSFAFFSVFASSLQVASMLFTVYILTSYTFSVFSLEEKYHAERYIASLPVKRRDVVFARYANTMVVIVVYFILAFLVNIAFLIVKFTPARPIPLEYCAIVFAAACLTSAVCVPSFFRLGITRSRAVIMLVLVIPFMGYGLVMGFGPSIGLLPAQASTATIPITSLPLRPLDSILMAVAALLVWAASIPLSVFLYSRRDLQ